jgi:trans-aconitate methyltransferase
MDQCSVKPANGFVPVIFKSKPLTGIMAEQYFDLANLGHFWCRRRFEVLQTLAAEQLREARNIAEIGCGNGVLQRQVEDAYGAAPIGFDLHERALRQNLCRRGKVYCYDIHDRDPEFRAAFDLLLMFDVLEHIEDEDAFLASARFHLAPGGSLIINVPALQSLYSAYDQVQGHQRRYNIAMLRDVARRNGFQLRRWTYWGAPLLPVAALRKALLALARNRPDTYSIGFDPKKEFINTWLYRLSRLEPVPQHVAGTSLMTVLETND